MGVTAGMLQGELTVDMVVQRLGVTPRTLHYYEEVGLIGQVRRTNGGHRLYDEVTVERLEQIIKLRDVLGYSLNEIKQIMHVEKMLTEYRKNLGGDLSNQEKAAIFTSSAEMLGDLVGRINLKIDRLTQMRDTYQQRLERVEARLQEEVGDNS